MTETVCRLGATDRLVGATRYCVEPAADLASVPRVGGTKNPNLEKVASLSPDLVLVNSEENRAEDIAWLRQRFAVLEHCPRTVVAAAGAVRDLARALDLLPAAQPFLLRIEAQIARAQVVAVARAPVRVFYAIWKKPWMGANRDTYIHDVLTRAGGDNVCAGLPDRYPEVTPSQVREAGVELVLLPSEPYEFGVADQAEVAAAGLFGADVPVVLCDGRDFCWHGARTADGLGNALALLKAYRTRRPG